MQLEKSYILSDFVIEIPSSSIIDTIDKFEMVITVD